MRRTASGRLRSSDLLSFYDNPEETRELAERLGRSVDGLMIYQSLHVTKRDGGGIADPQLN